MALEFNELLSLLIKDHYVDVLVAELGELDGLLEEAPLPLAKGGLLLLVVNNRGVAGSSPLLNGFAYHLI